MKSLDERLEIIMTIQRKIFHIRDRAFVEIGEDLKDLHSIENTIPQCFSQLIDLILQLTNKKCEFEADLKKYRNFLFKERNLIHDSSEEADWLFEDQKYYDDRIILSKIMNLIELAIDYKNAIVARGYQFDRIRKLAELRRKIVDPYER